MTYWLVVFLAGFQLAFLVSYASVIYHYQSAQTKHKLFVSRFCRPRCQNVIVGHKVTFRRFPRLLGTLVWADVFRFLDFRIPMGRDDVVISHHTMLHLSPEDQFVSVQWEAIAFRQWNFKLPMERLCLKSRLENYSKVTTTVKSRILSIKVWSDHLIWVEIFKDGIPAGIKFATWWKWRKWTE